MMTNCVKIAPQTTPLGFIGTGVMGKSIVAHLLRQGYRVYIYNRTQSKAQDLITQGAIWCDNIPQVARQSQVIFTMVGFPPEVRQVYLGVDGILSHAPKNSIICDLTTSEPELAATIFALAKSRQVYTLDAPVTGGDRGAREGTLTMMVGGETEVLDMMKPLLQVFCKKIVHFGVPGAGQNAKMVNQIAIAGAMLGMAEALWYADKSGLDLSAILDVISSGSAGSWSLTNYGPRILKQDFAPGFFIKHFVKDMEIAQRQADENKLSLPMLEIAIKMYRTAIESGSGELGTQAIYILKEKIQEQFQKKM